jgi:ribosomal protein L37AE/L43A
MNTTPEPIHDLVDGGPDGPICPNCGGQADSRLRTPDVATWYWHCDHCRINWTPDGTGGEQT